MLDARAEHVEQVCLSCLVALCLFVLWYRCEAALFLPHTLMIDMPVPRYRRCLSIAHFFDATFIHVIPSVLRPPPPPSSFVGIDVAESSRGRAEIGFEPGEGSHGAIIAFDASPLPPRAYADAATARHLFAAAKPPFRCCASIDSPPFTPR